ncbi:MAG: hypothetical protein HY318_05300, partial [Armatimonadetes bacterium]|nr:hypothetical protein [Armatimonadota bacterium]
MEQIITSRYEMHRRRPGPLNSCRRATLGFAPTAALAMLLLVHAVGMVHGASRVVYVIRLEDKVINPVTARYIVHGINRAEETRAEALALVLD